MDLGLACKALANNSGTITQNGTDKITKIKCIFEAHYGIAYKMMNPF